MLSELIQMLNWAKANYKRNDEFLKKLKKAKPKDLDANFHLLHEQVFEKVDCLDCANCCKTTSPIFHGTDIDRIASKLGMKRSTFIDEYLRLDEDADYVLTSAPCPFLGHDHKCFIYDARPKACKEYPHTDRKQMHQILPLTLNNTLICPAVSEIVKNINHTYQ